MYDVESIFRISVYVALLLPARVRALVSAISSAFCEEVPKGRDWDSVISVSETIALSSYVFSL